MLRLIFLASLCRTPGAGRPSAYPAAVALESTFSEDRNRCASVVAGIERALTQEVSAWVFTRWTIGRGER